VNLNFAQTITVRCKDVDGLVALLEEWDRNQAAADIMGYIGTHVLRDRSDPDHFVIVAEFGVVELDVPAADEAARNNDRPETQEWARRMRELIDGEPVYRDYDEVYRTG
jgi:quinol monooxygenase YgiN